jgi:hypothetical protein
MGQSDSDIAITHTKKVHNSGHRMGQSDSDIAVTHKKKVHNSMTSEVKALIYVKPSSFY